jgi:hypothetical protein
VPKLTNAHIDAAHSWLLNWLSDNFDSPGYYEEKSTFAAQAAQCRAQAKADGISAAALREVAGEDLEAYLLNHQNDLTDQHVHDLAAKDD